MYDDLNFVSQEFKLMYVCMYVFILCAYEDYSYVMN